MRPAITRGSDDSSKSPVDKLHGNSGALMYIKYQLIAAHAQIRALSAGPRENVRSIYKRHKDTVLKAALSDEAFINYAVSLLYIANYFLGIWAHRHATMTADGHSVYDRLPTELYVGSYKRYARELVGTQLCSTVNAGVFSSAVTYAFRGSVTDKAQEFLKFACGLLNTSVTIAGTLYPENSICVGASGSPDSYSGIRNDGLTDKFFDALQKDLNMTTRLWVNCESAAENNFWSKAGFTFLDYGSHLTSMVITLYAVYKLLEYTYGFICQSLENFKEWRSHQEWYKNSAAHSL